jgi:hypothetical protein
MTGLYGDVLTDEIRKALTEMGCCESIIRQSGTISRAVQVALKDSGYALVKTEGPFHPSVKRDDTKPRQRTRLRPGAHEGP